jgi:hypothetical protein
VSGAGQSGAPGQAALLAVGAAGLVSALLALWAMRGLPFGAVLLWLAPLPLFAAAAGFGPRVAWGAAGVGAAAVLIGSNSLGAALYLGAFALPAALIAATAFPGGALAGRLDLSVPLALLGLWPALVLAVVALMVSDLEGAMREAVAQGVRRMGVPLAEGMIEQIARVKAAAVGFWTALLMLGNGLAGQRLMERQGLALAPLPLVALAAWAAFGGVFTLSALLILLIPFFLLGVAGVHRRLRGRAGRLAFLAGFYLLMLLFLQIMAPLMVGVGLFDQFRRRAAPSNPT